ncbi:RES family NAD+ phosphorylase [Rugamonas apoptosis]|uniref:RES family NAD+ phosphorylase n=1 Tax=Rugamonas apoptosis TaxID=2758570 RepID=A0A7W2FFB3_9BURK|nr:RES family NAD+ phosphorylase [Rugamonas apoptosis]MBA5690667.1 RES family NAD+ phosphorylase [Rugamonas apoptosis]
MPPLSNLVAPPKNFAGMLPEFEYLNQVLSDGVIELPAKQPLVRAAWNAASVWPTSVNRTYRFGPPEDLVGADGAFPFHWVYAANEVLTAVWEARLCVNDVTRPGTFQFAPKAEQALIATLRCAQPLRLLDLSGDLASKLGIYDALRSPDYGFCQWLGYFLDRIIASHDGAIHGFCYPSRRHPGQDAYAISSRSMAALTEGLLITTELFGATAAYARLSQDRCRV